MYLPKAPYEDKYSFFSWSDIYLDIQLLSISNSVEYKEHRWWMDENLRSLIMKINTFKYQIYAITIGGLTSYTKCDI